MRPIKASTRCDVPYKSLVKAGLELVRHSLARLIRSQHDDMAPSQAVLLVQLSKPTGWLVGHKVGLKRRAATAAPQRGEGNAVATCVMNVLGVLPSC